MADVFRRYGYDAEVQTIDDSDPIDPCEIDLLGVGSPCHHGKAPTPMKKFLQSLPSLDDTLAFVFTTSGGASGRVLHDISRVLRRKGARILGNHSTVAKINHPAPSLFGRNPNRPSTRDLRRCQDFARAVVKTASHEPMNDLPSAYQNPYMSRGFYDLLSYISTDSVVRWMMPAPELENARCQSCGFCSKSCPMANIAVEHFPRSQGRCIRCYHCVAVCPSKARSVRWNRRSRMVEALYSPRMVRRFGDSNIRYA
jgi:ferredoxin